jgi:hypothetical protein
MLESGPGARLLGELVSDEMKIRTNEARSFFLRAAASHGVRIELGISAEAKGLLVQILEENFRRLTSELMEDTPFISSTAMRSTVKPTMDMLTTNFDRKKNVLNMS